MTRRENILKAIRFDTPEHIPMTFHINSACWNHYDHEFLKDMKEAHPLLFPGYERTDGAVTPNYNPDQRRDAPYLDPWGCLWETAENGITGSVHRHPLESWDAFESYMPPDPEQTSGMFPVDWQRMANDIEDARAAGDFIKMGLPHGHTFLRLQDIRGYTNLLYDMMDQTPELERLIEMVAEFNLAVVTHLLALKPDMIGYAEDLGMQVGPMLSPDQFRTYIKPVYRRIMQPAREKGVIVHMHSDGDIRTLVDDLVEGGVEVLNLQDLVNGIDWIATRFAGRTCVELDIDRQSITAQGRPEQIDTLIHEEVEKIGSKRGGLMMVYGLYPGVPPENVRAVMDAMERYAAYYS